MEKKNLQMTTLLVLLLLFVFWGGVGVKGKKECRLRTTSKCRPKEKCDPHICQVQCTHDANFDESECGDRHGNVDLLHGICYCMSGCRGNSTAAAPRRPRPPPHLRRPSPYASRCM